MRLTRGLVQDIKPANLFVARNLDGPESVRFSTSGCDSWGRSGRCGPLWEGACLVDYASPEQALRQPLDGRTDLYAVGVILYELLWVFRSRGASKTLKATWRSLFFLPLEFPRDLADLVESLLEKDPNRRPQTAIQVSHWTVLREECARENRQHPAAPKRDGLPVAPVTDCPRDRKPQV